VPVRRARGAGERDAAIALRQLVFCEEQGVPRELELDGRDEDALHIVAVRGGEVIGTCRVLLDGATAKLGRMAVASAERGRGLGSSLLEAAEREAVAAGAARVALHAQEQARELYAANGYRPYGEPFEQAGIPHIAMEKTLS
jgi:predicted GNAT family N-acyltransferase